MRRKRIGRYSLVDVDTGEKYDALIVPVIPKERSIGGRFMKVFWNALDILSKRKPKGMTVRVFVRLVCEAGKSNKVPNTANMARIMGIKQPHISNVYKELMGIEIMGRGFLVKKDNDYYLNPLVSWNGSNKAQQEVIDYLYERDKYTPKVISVPMVCEPKLKYLK